MTRTRTELTSYNMALIVVDYEISVLKRLSVLPFDKVKTLLISRNYIQSRIDTLSKKTLKKIS